MSEENKKFVLELALAQAPQLSQEDRIKLYQGVYDLMPETEIGEAAGNAAFFLVRADKEQLKLKELIL